MARALSSVGLDLHPLRPGQSVGPNGMADLPADPGRASDPRALDASSKATETVRGHSEQAGMLYHPALESAPERARERTVTRRRPEKTADAAGPTVHERRST